MPVVGNSFARSSLLSSVFKELMVMLIARRSASNYQIKESARVFLWIGREIPPAGSGP